MSKQVGAMNGKEAILRVNAERSRQIVHAPPVAMLVARVPDETLEIANAKFTKLFGYTAKDIPGVSHWWHLAYPDEEYRSEMQDAWQQRIQKVLRNSGDIEPMEARIRCKDGTVRAERSWPGPGLMRERVGLLRGAISIESDKCSGTAIEVRIPINR